ncbi:hypothetical protein Prudu_432S000300 [Prunus dulcis]|uniref:Uncharacterized protein n=1 Tax=Prunus dulcis TaxID=3755 RepID=A0A5H2Y199_PRUDU|nr:hypothetical protein Prudu_432S000300 [Prunus dulcis]
MDDAYSISSISSSIALHSHSSISLKSQLHSFLQPEKAPPTSSSPSEEQISAKTQKPTSSSPSEEQISAKTQKPTSSSPAASSISVEINRNTEHEKR